MRGLQVLYDQFLPWLLGVPLEHYLSEAPSYPERTPQYGDTAVWRAMTYALRYALESVHGVSREHAKAVRPDPPQPARKSNVKGGRISVLRHHFAAKECRVYAAWGYPEYSSRLQRKWVAGTGCGGWGVSVSGVCASVLGLSTTPEKTYSFLQ